MRHNNRRAVLQKRVSARASRLPQRDQFASASAQAISSTRRVRDPLVVFANGADALPTEYLTTHLTTYPWRSRRSRRGQPSYARAIIGFLKGSMGGPGSL